MKEVQIAHYPKGRIDVNEMIGVTSIRKCEPNWETRWEIIQMLVEEYEPDYDVVVQFTEDDR